ncbi:hypothetical protein SO802_027367 [Lithocarpus litseifolius]|uniref:RNase H type-1 domain-containing protein n=1 Tax=Lithocarpus litseifolius TaxID=425828 RepID=A0AAW2C2S0_9ROSI
MKKKRKRKKLFWLQEDYCGRLLSIYSLSKKITQPHSVEILEILATRRAIQFTVELGFHHATFEGDVEGVIKALSLGSFPIATTRHLVKDCKSIVGSLRAYSFSRTRRQGNKVAYALARGARFSFILQVWMEDIPPNTFNFVVDDFPV